MNVLDLTLFSSPLPFPSTEKSLLSDPASHFFAKVATFIYETPLWVVVSLIIGVVLLIFHPLFSAPFFVAAGTFILTRLIVKIIEIYAPQKLKNFRASLYNFQDKYPYIQYLAMAVCLATTPFLPIAAAFLSIPLGIYKGLVAEIDVFKHKQHVEKETLKHKFLDCKVKLLAF